MIGAIAGDIISSVFEHYPIKSTHFPLFTRHSYNVSEFVFPFLLKVEARFWG